MCLIYRPAKGEGKTGIKIQICLFNPGRTNVKSSADENMKKGWPNIRDSPIFT
jgi:hypothetical protein